MVEEKIYTRIFKIGHENHEGVLKTGGKGPQFYLNPKGEDIEHPSFRFKNKEDMTQVFSMLVTYFRISKTSEDFDKLKKAMIMLLSDLES